MTLHEYYLCTWRLGSSKREFCVEEQSRNLVSSPKHLHFSRWVFSYLGLPWWFSGKESCQCRRRGFEPWVGKIPWRSKWQPTPVFSPGKFHGQRSLVGYSPRGHKESDTTEYECFSYPLFLQTFLWLEAILRSMVPCAHMHILDFSTLFLPKRAQEVLNCALLSSSKRIQISYLFCVFLHDFSGRHILLC